MYEIISNGNRLAYVDSPRYVRYKEESNAWVLAPYKDAEAIAVNSTLYSIDGKEPIPDTEVVTVHEVPAGTVVTATEDEVIAAHDRIAELEDALCEMDSMILNGEVKA